MPDMSHAEPEAPTQDETLEDEVQTTVRDRELRTWLSVIAALLVQIAVCVQSAAEVRGGHSLRATMEQELSALLNPPTTARTPEELCQLAVSQELPTFLARSGLSPLVVMWWKAVSLQWLDIPRTEARRDAIQTMRGWTEQQLRQTPDTIIDATWQRLAAMADLTHTEAEGLRWAEQRWREAAGGRAADGL